MSRTHLIYVALAALLLLSLLIVIFPPNVGQAELVAYVMVPTMSLVVVVLYLTMSVRKTAVWFNEDHMRIRGPMLDKVVNYSDIVSVDLRNDVKYGAKSMGYMGSKYIGGSFDNEEFRHYFVSANYEVKSCIVVRYSKKTVLVFNMETEDETLLTYNALKSRAKHRTPSTRIL
ncbi:MAG: hypothetical protein LBV63_04925 [Candidatus Methanoplasma sp.]|jgi:hypothetical protein|nr:hypothetical protein [Candidatus Methanoplasma sp.]